MARTQSHPPPGRQPIRGSVRWSAALATIAACGAAAVAPTAAQAASNVAITVSLLNNVYSISVFDGTPVDLYDVDFTFAGSPNLTSFSAPGGNTSTSPYQIGYDQGSGNLALTANASNFVAGTTTSPFTFFFSGPLTLKVVEGVDANLSSLTANTPIVLPTVSGTSRTDNISVGGSIAPEPGSMSLFALGATTSLGLIARRRIGSKQRTS